MFSLVITLIAISLVSALALATLYYGRDALSDASSKALASRALLEGQQLEGAVSLASADGLVLEGTSSAIEQSLVSGQYLQQVPRTESGWSFASQAIVLDLGAQEKACLVINHKLGISGIPSCTDAAYLDSRSCCAMP